MTTKQLLYNTLAVTIRSLAFLESKVNTLLETQTTDGLKTTQDETHNALRDRNA